MSKPQSRNGAGGPFYCLHCGSSHVTAVSASPWQMRCINPECPLAESGGSVEIGIRDRLTITQAARWKNFEHHDLSIQLAKYKAKPVIRGRRKLFKLSEIERVIAKLES